jgi:hypothetical protein
VLGARINLLDLLFTSAQLVNAGNLVDVGLALPPDLFSNASTLLPTLAPIAGLSQWQRHAAVSGRVSYVWQKAIFRPEGTSR